MTINFSIPRKTILVNGLLTSYYLLSAKSESPVFVFLHGWGAESRTWVSIFPLINGKYNCYFLDLPGFGDSEKPKISFNLDEYAGFVNDWLSKLGLKNIVLVGHSFGGSIAALIAGKYPERVEKLVLVDSAGIRISSKVKTLKNSVANFVKPLFKPDFMQPVRKWIYSQMGAEDYLAIPKMQDTYRKIISQDITLKLQLIKQPTLIIWGAHDKVTPMADAEVFHKSIPTSSLIIIHSAAHMVFLDQPEVFTRTLFQI